MSEYPVFFQFYFVDSEMTLRMAIEYAKKYFQFYFVDSVER